MQGARIASASWGSADTSYVTECVEIDALARQRDMLILVAAGEWLRVQRQHRRTGAGIGSFTSFILHACSYAVSAL